MYKPTPFYYVLTAIVIGFLSCRKDINDVRTMYVQSTAKTLPAFTANTPSFVDEGTSIGSWTLVNTTASHPDADHVLFTQTSTGAASATIPVTFPVANKDWNLYAKISARATAGDWEQLQLIGSGTSRVHVDLNYNSSTNTPQLGTISLRTVSASNNVKKDVAATGVNTEECIDIALHYDSKFASMSIEFRQPDGTWVFGAQITGAYFTGSLALRVNQTTSTGAWVGFDFLEIVSPNIISIGESVTAGMKNFNPNLTLGLNDGGNRWQQYAALYPGERNNYIVNKGVGGNTTAQMLARFNADAVANHPKAVVIAACSNDRGANVSYTTRKANMQACINMCTAIGAKVIVINGIGCTATFVAPDGVGQPTVRDYMAGSWTYLLANLTGVDNYADVMQPIMGADGYQDPSYSNADQSHLNNAGAQLFGEYIAAQ